MIVRRFPATAALVAWTVLVWATRIRNIAADGELDGAARAGRLALAISFTVAAAVVAACLWRSRHLTGTGPLVTVVSALAAWTAVVWTVRMAGIATGGHDAGFVAVHLVLAVVSVALAVAAVREVRRARRAPGGDAGVRPARPTAV